MEANRDRYVGRFAPSPSGRLHAGSLVAAVASFLDARAHHGRWLVRIEDVDEARSAPGAAEAILALLQTLGMQWDGEVVWQSRRTQLYQAAFEQLAGHAYPCGCNRREIVDSRLGVGPDGAAIYPGTCRHGLGPGKAMRSLRLRVPDACPAGEGKDGGDAVGFTDREGRGDAVAFTDRFCGPVVQHLARESGDFILRRADGFWAYQLAVVVDDAQQGVTDVVRGADLIDSTARQIYLQRLLGVPTPRYLHVPVVRNAEGEKLSKQTGAAACTAHDEAGAVAVLREAALFLGLPPIEAGSVARFWQAAIPAWDALLAGRRQNLPPYALLR